MDLFWFECFPMLVVDVIASVASVEAVGVVGVVGVVVGMVVMVVAAAAVVVAAVEMELLVLNLNLCNHHRLRPLVAFLCVLMVANDVSFNLSFFLFCDYTYVFEVVCEKKITM